MVSEGVVAQLHLLFKIVFRSARDKLQLICSIT